MSTTPLRYQLRDAVVDALKQGVPEVDGRVYSQFYRAYDNNDYPAINVQVGARMDAYEGGGQGIGTRAVNSDFVVSVDIVDNSDAETFRSRPGEITAKARAVVCQMHAQPDILDVQSQGEQPVEYASQRGRAGGFSLTFTFSFAVGEDDFETAV